MSIKMKKCVFLFLVSIIAAACNNAGEESAKDIAGLKGDVKKVISIDYEAFNKFGEGEILISKPEYAGSSIHTYDSIGNIINVKHYYLDKRDISYEMFYDSKGNWTKFISYNDEGEISLSEAYEYNDNGDKIKELDLLDGDITNIEIKYNNKGQKISSTERDGIFTITETYEYEGENLVKETRIFKGYYYKSTYITQYEYNEQGKLVELLKYNNGKLTDKYVYNENENLKFHKEIEDGKITCEHYKYDEFQRVVEYLKTNGEEVNNSNIISKIKYHRFNKAAPSAYRVQAWNETGELESDNYHHFYVLKNDTISHITIDKDDNISYIRRFIRNNGVQYTTYDIESSHTEIFYNYIDGKLVSENYSNGSTIYEYDKNKLVKKSTKLSDIEIVALYKNGRETSIICYDKDKQETSKETFSYEGNKRNGKIISTYTSKEDGHIYTETIYVDGKISVVKKQNIIYEYAYNEQGDIVEIKASNGENKRFEYEYDEFGNWIKRIFYNQNDITVTERLIEYF